MSSAPDDLAHLRADAGIGPGYTVERGTTPAPFTATVLGRIADGIAPGIDMIMAELDSPAIDRAGVWAGMSGSPVYAEDGRLIGSVSYGLAASSPIAGITPAARMKSLLALPAAAGGAGLAAAGDRVVAARKIPVSAAVAERLAATGEVSAAEAAPGFRQLPLPVTVSGLSGISSAHAQARMAALQTEIPGSRVLSGGAAAASGNTPADIVPGGNFAAAISYGDATVGGVGTTTFVCNNNAVAFGHPFQFTGAANASVHPATAVFVQADPVFGSVKVANIDRVLNAVGPGSAAVTFTVRGVRANGAAFTVTRTDHIASQFDISVEVASAAAELVDKILKQPMERVRLTAMSVTGTLDPALHRYRVTSVKVKQGGVFVTPNGPLQAKAGSVLAVRLALAPYQATGSKIVDLAVPVPKDTAGLIGSLDVATGPVPLDTSAADTFPELLAMLRSQPAGNTARATLTVTPDTGPAVVSAASASVDQAIAAFDGLFDVQIT